MYLADWLVPRLRQETNGAVPDAVVEQRRQTVNNIFYIIGVVVVVLIILGYLGFR